MPELILTDADNGKTASVQAGSRVRVRLPENPTTGYRWSLQPSDGSRLSHASDDYRAAPGSAVGGGGVREFVFAAERSGEQTITLKLVRPWDDDKQPATTFTAVVRVT